MVLSILFLNKHIRYLNALRENRDATDDGICSSLPLNGVRGRKIQLLANARWTVARSWLWRNMSREKEREREDYPHNCFEEEVSQRYVSLFFIPEEWRGRRGSRRRDSSRFVKKANAAKRSVMGPESKHNCPANDGKNARKKRRIRRGFLLFHFVAIREKQAWKCRSPNLHMVVFVGSWVNFSFIRLEFHRSASENKS